MKVPCVGYVITGYVVATDLQHAQRQAANGTIFQTRWDAKKQENMTHLAHQLYPVIVTINIETPEGTS